MLTLCNGLKMGKCEEGQMGRLWITDNELKINYLVIFNNYVSILTYNHLSFFCKPAHFHI